MKSVIRVHRSGVFYIVVSIVMGILAINGGNNFHYLATAAILGYMLASGVAGRRNIMGAKLALSCPDEIYAGTCFLLTVEVCNQNRRVPIYLIDVQIGESVLSFPIVQPGETVSKSLLHSFPSRGRHEVADAQISSVYPFNLFTRYAPVGTMPAAIVFPVPASPEGESSFLRTDALGAGGASPKLLSDSDILGIRPYVEGDPMKLVHWKSSARTGKLNTRVYDLSEEEGSRIIDLDDLMTHGHERGLSVAAYILAEAIRSQEPVGMRDGDTVYAVSSARADKLAMLSRLALHE